MKTFKYLSLLALVIAFCVIVLGAYVRLSDAGLGCPDWPGCYGKLLVPESTESLADHYQTEETRTLVVSKAWKEMIHRYLASTLGLLILILAFLAWRNRGDPYQPLVLPFMLVALVILQGMLGMWTVTLLLKPLVVTAHLLGGMTTLLLLGWMVLSLRKQKLEPLMYQENRALFPLAVIAMCVLYAQIFLGGWTSSNYAALICPDFPTCQNRWWPAMDFREGFTLWHGIGIDYEYGILKTDARTAVHMTHRIGALITFSVLLALVFTTQKSQVATIRQKGILLLLLLCLQVMLGIANITLGLPLAVAVAHNGGAALLLLSLTSLFHTIKTTRR